MLTQKWIIVLFLLFADIFIESYTASPRVERRSVTDPFTDYDWLAKGSDELSRVREVYEKNIIDHQAKNAIVFVGDGLGISTTAAARILNYQRHNGDVDMAEVKMAYEKMPHHGLSMTYCTDAITADSACTATALFTGHKTRDGTLSVDHRVRKGDCHASRDTDTHLTSIIRHAQLAGKSTGLVTTARITHATPAATYAHVAHRGWESEALDGCMDIATQLVTQDTGKHMQVILGGGRKHFLPNTTADPEYSDETGARIDGRDLLQEWRDVHESMSGVKASEVQYVWNKQQFDSIDSGRVKHVLGLFESSHMQYHKERVAEGELGEPSLTEMVEKALSILKHNRNGYLLVVEGARIDHAHHSNYAQMALEETLEYSRAVQAALDNTDAEDTLIISTADHSHVFTLGGYSDLTTDLLGTVDRLSKLGNLALDSKHVMNLGYTNGPGYFQHRYDLAENEEIPEAFEDFDSDRSHTRVDPITMEEHFHDLRFRSDAGIPLVDDTHGGEDVGLYGRGPQAHLIHSTHEQTHVAHVVMYAMCIGPYHHTCEAKHGANSGSAATSPNGAVSLWIIFVTIGCFYSYFVK